MKFVVDPLIGGFRYLYAIGHSRGFEAACGIYRVAPDVIDKSMLTDDAGHHLSRMDADANLKVFAELRPDLTHRLNHAERHVGYREGMIRLFFRYPAGHHIGVTDGFDLFKPQT